MLLSMASQALSSASVMPAGGRVWREGCSSLHPGFKCDNQFLVTKTHAVRCTQPSMQKANHLLAFQGQAHAQVADVEHQDEGRQGQGPRHEDGGRQQQVDKQGDVPGSVPAARVS